MKTCKAIMFIIGLSLVIVGIYPYVTTLLEYIRSLGISTEEAYLLLGCLDLFILFIIHIAGSRRDMVIKLRISEETISDLECRIYGRTITVDDIFEFRSRTVPTSDSAECTGLDTKEIKYRQAMDKMERRRRVAPPLKKKRVRHIESSKVSYKERVGGIRRAS